MISEFSGQNREQLDEVMYLLGGMDSNNSRLVRRASALKLLKAIQDSKASFLIRANGGFQKIFKAFQDEDDEVCIHICICLLAVNHTYLDENHVLIAHGLF